MKTSNNNVNESMFDGVVVVDEIKRVSDGRAVECSPASSMAAMMADRQWQQACIHSKVDLEHSRWQWHAYGPSDGDLQRIR